MKKGFTLVELLAVILLISLFSILTFNSIVKKSNELKEESNNKYSEVIKSSAKMYVDSNQDIKLKIKSGQTIKISYKQLQDLGYLTINLNDLSKNRINPNNKCVQVSYQNYSYLYTLTNCD